MTDGVIAALLCMACGSAAQPLTLYMIPNTHGKQLELRMLETPGKSGVAEVILRLPHPSAWVANMMSR